MSSVFCRPFHRQETQALTVSDYPKAMLADDELSEAVSAKVETFYRNIKHRRPAEDGACGQVAVLFSQRRSKKTLWFSSTEVRKSVLISI